MNEKLILCPKVILLTIILLCILLAPVGFGATLVVTNLASLGPGTLRQALSDNQALGGGNTIIFSNNLSGTITLGGTLSVNAPVTILGPGTNVLSISGNNLVRVFTVTAGPTLISDLTIRNGRATGSDGMGGQPNGGDGQGGGVFNLNGALTISNCVVLSNSVVGGVGATRQNGVVGSGGRGQGGGVYNSGGTLMLASCVFLGNQATGGRGGSAQSTGAGPGAEGQGGAVFTSSGPAQVIACSFVNNQVSGGLGGTMGGSSQLGGGGSGYGGGIYSVSPLIISRSTLRGSIASGGNGGDGIANGVGSGQGGGIYSISTLSLFSSTVASNSASGIGPDFGGGIFSGSDTGITNSTIAFNQSDSGGGIHGAASAANTIIARNTAGNGPDVNGTITSQDYNLIQNTNGASLLGITTHVITGADPLLGPLQDNGGPTFTMALPSGSPAVDQGKSFGLATDQRGLNRPSNFPSITNAAGGDGSDIGAFELQATPREFGVDVSHFQGETGVSQASWNSMFASGKRFAFIKATEGLSVLDAAMENNVNRSTAAGLRAGVYHYAHPELRNTTNGAIQEADYLLTYAGNFIGPGYLRPVLDVEFSASAPTTTELTDWVIAFANEITKHRGAGAAPIIYCNQSFANLEFDSRLASYDLWLRTITGLDPASNDPPSGFVDPTGVFDNWSFWQYNDAGSSGGISPLDLNICHSEFKPLDSFLIPAVTDPVSPNIAVQPVSRTVIVSNNTSFSVTPTVDTSTPFGYQWRFNGTNILGATARTFMRTNVQFADAGDYTVVITNVANSITSSVATLTVIPPPPPFQGVTLWSEDFDGYASPSIVTTDGTTNGFKIFFSAVSGPLDFTARFGFDYSTVSSPINVPSAPHSTNGTTKGLTLTVNKDATAAIAAVNLYPISQMFTGSYAFKFELWINHANNGTATEHALFGINHSGNITNRVALPTSDGLFFAMDGDGGISSGSTTVRDFSVFAGGGVGLSPWLLSTNSFFGPEPLLGPQFDNADPGFAALFPPKALPGSTTAPGSPGLGWIRVEVRQLTNQITWLLDDVIVAQYTNTFPFTDGNILIGYNDAVVSTGSSANFAIFDNLRVETAIPDYDHDGLSDQWEVQYLGNLSANPDDDADGDNVSNLNEFLAGTNPTNAASALRLTGERIGNGILLNWTAVGGRSYVVQSQSTSSGSLTGNFADLSPVITVGGTNETSTNYLHVGGATNAGAYYRVRLHP